MYIVHPALLYIVQLLLNFNRARWDIKCLDDQMFLKQNQYESLIIDYQYQIPVPRGSTQLKISEFTQNILEYFGFQWQTFGRNSESS